MEALLNTCKTACDEMTPFIEAVYAQLGNDPNASVLKADASYFSLADGVVQARCHLSSPLSHVMRHTSLRTRPRAGGRFFTFDERC